jgi:hypothetical protein
MKDGYVCLVLQPKTKRINGKFQLMFFECPIEI